LIALSRDGKAYYWARCRSTLGAGKGLQMVGVADDITGINKVVSFPEGGHPDAYLLSDGRMALVFPPDPASDNTYCIDLVMITKTPPVFVSKMPVRVIDAAFPAGDLGDFFSILMVGSDGSLWKINVITYPVGLTNLTNINLP